MTRSIGPRSGRPVVTLSFVAASTASSVWPGAAAVFEFARSSIGDGEWWRLATGQFVHWSPAMTLVDLAIVSLLGAWLERRRVTGARVAFGAAILGIGPGLYVAAPLLERFRGSSGIATALFVVFALHLFRRDERPAIRGLALALIALLAAKLAWEGLGGRAWTGTLPAGVRVEPWAHALGAAAGVATFFSMEVSGRGDEWRSRRDSNPRSPE